jgi:hypothetical protein
MDQENLQSFQEVFSFFEQQVHALGDKFNRTPVNWQEVFDENLQLPSNAIVQVWKEYVFRISNLEFRISDFGFRISDFGFRISDF